MKNFMSWFMSQTLMARIAVVIMGLILTVTVISLITRPTKETSPVDTEPIGVSTVEPSDNPTNAPETIEPTPEPGYNIASPETLFDKDAENVSASEYRKAQEVIYNTVIQWYAVSSVETTEVREKRLEPFFSEDNALIKGYPLGNISNTGDGATNAKVTINAEYPIGAKGNKTIIEYNVTYEILITEEGVSPMMYTGDERIRVTAEKTGSVWKVTDIYNLSNN